ILCPEHRPQMATVRPKVFPMPAPDADRRGEVCREALPPMESPVHLLEGLPAPGGDARLDADILVAVGNDIGGDENLAMARELAQRLDGGLAATRPLVDAGRAPYPHQVGQTGKTVAPKVYLALGISGAIQHMAGVQAERIIAVNADPDAPIFAQADEAVVADCGAFLRELLTLIPQRK
ncbi:MAG: electron transfer flavoprotein subunit alpha/FixB family protein, partial [Acutalibacteraceae bacterium]